MYKRQKEILHQHRIEKLLVVDDQYSCIGLITVKDIEKSNSHPNATKDEKGRLRVAAGTTVGDRGFERAEALIDSDTDIIVVDTIPPMDIQYRFPKQLRELRNYQTQFKLLLEMLQQKKQQNY